MDARIRDGARRKYRIVAVPKRAQICSDIKKNWGATKKKIRNTCKNVDLHRFNVFKPF